MTHIYRHSTEANGSVSTVCSCGWKNNATGSNARLAADIAAVEHEFVDNPDNQTFEVRLMRVERLVSVLARHFQITI